MHSSESIYRQRLHIPFTVNINEQLIIYKCTMEQVQVSHFFWKFAVCLFIYNISFSSHCEDMPCGCKCRHVHHFSTHSASQCKIKASLRVSTSCGTRQTTLWGGYHTFNLTPCRWWGSRAQKNSQNLYFLRQLL